MNWQIFAFLSVIFYSVSIILQKALLKDEKHNPIAFSILFQISVGLLIGIYAFIIHQLRFPNFSSLIFNLLFMIILWVATNIFWFKAMKKTDVSKLSIIFSTRVLFYVGAATVFLNQTLSFKQGVGMILVLAGVVLVSLKEKRVIFTKYDWLTVFAAFSIGLAFVNDKYLLNYFNPYTYASFSFLVPGVSLAFLYLKSSKEMVVFLNKKNRYNFMLVVLVHVIATIVFYIGLKLTPNASQYGVINLSQVVMIVVLSIIFLRERENILKTATATFICFVGLVLVNS